MGLEDGQNVFVEGLGAHDRREEQQGEGEAGHGAYCRIAQRIKNPSLRWDFFRIRSAISCRWCYRGPSWLR